MGGAVVPEVLFEFAIHQSVPKIFAIKVESCQKSLQISDVFTPCQILGACFPLPLPRAYRVEKNFVDTPTSPIVIRAHTLNLCQILNFKD